MLISSLLELYHKSYLVWIRLVGRSCCRRIGKDKGPKRLRLLGGKLMDIIMDIIMDITMEFMRHNNITLNIITHNITHNITNISNQQLSLCKEQVSTGLLILSTQTIIQPSGVNSQCIDNLLWHNHNSCMDRGKGRQVKQLNQTSPHQTSIMRRCSHLNWTLQEQDMLSKWMVQSMCLKRTVQVSSRLHTGVEGLIWVMD